MAQLPRCVPVCTLITYDDNNKLLPATPNT